jgi:hypothetical protein
MSTMIENTTPASDAGATNPKNPRNVVENLLRLFKERSGIKDDGLPAVTEEQWRAIRRTAGLQINPETVELMWAWSEEIHYDNSEEEPGRGEPCVALFARNPGSDELVAYADLPQATRDVLLEKAYGGTATLGPYLTYNE